jgi:hypothetical protein
MKSLTNKKLNRPVTCFLVLALCLSMFSAPAQAQPFYRPGVPIGRPYGYPPPPPVYYRGPNDFDKTLAIIGTVGAVAAIASGSRYNYNYYRYQPYPVVVAQPRPTVVVAPSRPTLVVEKPVVVEKQVIVERPVVIERQVPVQVNTVETYSPKLGASFRIEKMQIPGYKFTAARLTSDPVQSSPLSKIGLRAGDVVTRLNDSPVETLAELDRHERNTLIRYIKTGTTKVLLANIYIPTNAEVMSSSEIYYAP